MNVLSLFSGGGIGGSRLHELDIKVILAVEKIEDRCNFFSKIHDAEIFNNDISLIETKKKIYDFSKINEIDVIIATPPCQGMSIAGNMQPNDERNTLIFDAIEIIKKLKPKYIFLENVPRQLKTYIQLNEKKIRIPDYIYLSLKNEYFFNKEMLIKAMDHGVPQMRERNIMLLSRKDQNYIWQFPQKSNKILNLRDVLFDLPELDPFIREGIEKTLKIFPDFEKKKEYSKRFSKWHCPPVHNLNHVKIMQKTPTGNTAFDNKYYYPKKKDGNRVKGHYNHYRRLSWDKPSRSLTQNNGVISSLACVHPGRLVRDGDEKNRIYSDPRCFSIEEICIISSINFQNKLPIDTNQNLIRTLIGEGIPPLLVKKIFTNLLNNIQ